MNKTIAGFAAAAVAAGSLLISAPAASAATDASAHTAVAMKTAKDKRYLRDVVADAPSLAVIPDSQLIKSAKTTCKSLKVGLEPGDLIEIGIDSGLEDDEIVSLIANAVIYYCPGQAYKFE